MTLTELGAAWVDLADVHAVTAEREWAGRPDSAVWVVVVTSGGPVRVTRHATAESATNAAAELVERINAPEPPSAPGWLP